MGLTKTLANLETEILDLADLTTNQVSTATLDRMINNSLRSLYRILVASNRDFYLKEASPISVVSGTGAYSLATVAPDFWRCQGVEVLDGTRRYSLARYTFQNRNRFQGADITSKRTGYRIMGGYLRLFPTPAWSGSVYLWYIPAPPALSTGDSWEGFAGFERWTVFDVCAQLREMFEEDPSGFISERNRIEQEIRDSAAEIDDSEPDRIRDVEGEYVDEDELSR